MGSDGHVKTQEQKCQFPWTEKATGFVYQGCLKGGIYGWCPTVLGANSTFEGRTEDNYGFCKSSKKLRTSAPSCEAMRSMYAKLTRNPSYK